MSGVKKKVLTIPCLAQKEYKPAMLGQKQEATLTTILAVAFFFLSWHITRNKVLTDNILTNSWEPFAL